MIYKETRIQDYVELYVSISHDLYKNMSYNSGAIEIRLNYAHFMLLIMNATHNQRVIWIVLATIMIGNGFNELAMGCNDF